jgi:fructosamine-3-kinase
MMELFGTPPPAFWRAYRDAAGLHADYPRRRGVYQLVHLLKRESKDPRNQLDHQTNRV